MVDHEQMVECPACDGYGYRNEWVSPTSNPHVVCDVESHDCPYCDDGMIPEDEAALIA